MLTFNHGLDKEIAFHSSFQNGYFECILHIFPVIWFNIREIEEEKWIYEDFHYGKDAM